MYYIHLFSISKEEYHCRKRKHRKLYGNKLGVSYNVFIVSTIEYNRAFFSYSSSLLTIRDDKNKKKKSPLDFKSIKFMFEKSFDNFCCNHEIDI